MSKLMNFFLGNKLYAVDFDDYIASDYKLSPFKSLFLYNKIDQLARKAQFVTLGNHMSFDEIKSNNLIHLPTVIDLESYPNVKRNFKTEKVTIVWIGTPSTVKYLSLIIPVLERLNKKYPIKFKVIGAKIPPVKNLEIDLVNWNAETEADELISSDIGVMPLMETLFEKGKHGLKLIQYMAYGLPVVASALPANIEIVENGSNGYIVRNDEEWYYSLEKLIIDENLRKKLGQSGRKKIESNYPYQIWGDKYLKMITVDILLPTYNGERYIKEQITSLLEQTHLNIRIYIRDDRSTDGTVSIIENLSSKDSRIIIVKENNINLGLVGNINCLLSKSEADYIMYCDQDDVWFKDKVEVLLKEILHHEKEFGKKFPLLVHADCFVTDESLVVKGLFKGDEPLTYGLEKSLFKYYVQGASTIFNNSLKEQIYPFIENVYLHDRYTHLVAEIMGRRFYLNKPLMYYRQHTNNLVGSSSFFKKIKNNLSPENLTYFHLKDKLLITTLHKDKFPQNKLLKNYLEITSSKLSRIKKIKIIFSNQIAMRFKEFIILIIKN